METKRQRIWEIDALRGFLILCVILAHSLFYASYILQYFTLPEPVGFVIQYGGTLFVILSGLSATLGKRSFRRGLMVFGGGMLLTAGSLLAIRFGWLEEDMVIRFGVLHLLGLVMILYPLLKRIPSPALMACGLGIVALGLWLETQGSLTNSRLLFPLGLRFPGFSSGDYFPLAPHLGWFCLGIVLGRTIYGEKKTRLPQINSQLPVLRFFCFCGRNSLYIFIFHLPVLGVIMMLL